MAWGLWNKIKQGFKKVGNAVKNVVTKTASFVNDKIIKPFKPVISSVADKFIPGAGAVVEAVSDGIYDFANGDFRSGAQKMIGMPNHRNTNIRPYKKLNM